MTPKYISFRDNDGNIIGTYDPQVEGSLERTEEQIAQSNNISEIRRGSYIASLYNAATKPLPKKWKIANASAIAEIEERMFRIEDPENKRIATDIQESA